MISLKTIVTKLLVFSFIFTSIHTFAQSSNLKEIRTLEMNETEFYDALEALNVIAPVLSEHITKRSSKTVTEMFFSDSYFDLATYKNMITSNEMTEAVKTVKISKIDEARRKIKRYNREINGLKDDIREYRKEKRKAPESLPWYEDVYTKTKEDLEEDIEDAKQDIKDLEAKREDYLIIAKDDINKALESNFTAKQIRGILMTPEGDQFALSAAIIYNYQPLINKVTEVYTEAIESDEYFSNEELREFQGAYLAMLGVIAYAQERYLAENKKQQKKLASFIEDDLMPILKEARAGARNASKKATKANNILCFIFKCDNDSDSYDLSNDSKTLQNNVRTNEKTLKVANAYMDFLKKKHRIITDLRSSIDERLAILNNTYKTIGAIVKFQEFTRDGIHLFDQVSSLKMPDMTEITANLDELEAISIALENK